MIFVMCAFKFKVSVVFDEIQKDGRQTRRLVLNKNFLENGPFRRRPFPILVTDSLLYSGEKSVFYVILKF